MGFDTNAEILLIHAQLQQPEHEHPSTQCIEPAQPQATQLELKEKIKKP